MAFRFPLTMKAAQGGERNQWDFANALLKECGPPGKDGVNNGSTDKLQQAREELAANGFEYEITWLRHCRDTAAAFPPVSQETGVSFRVHMACATPAMLKAALKLWAKERPGEKLALHACTALIAQINKQRQAEFERKQAPAWKKAKESHDLAKASLKAAKERKLAAKTAKEREAAAAAIKRAERDKRAAEARMEDHALPPEGDPNAVPSETKMPAILFGMEVEGKAIKAVILADEVLELAKRLDAYHRGEGFHELGDADFEVVVEQARIAADKWRTVANIFEAAQGKKGSHLTVVAE